MTKQELQDLLNKHNISSQYYSLEGSPLPEVYCLFESSKGRIWEVFYSERGLKTGLKEFFSESDACEYFYNLLKRDGLIT